MALTRDKIIDRLVEEHGVQRREAVDFYDTFVEDIKKAVNAGERVRLTAFGALQKRQQRYHHKRADIDQTDLPFWTTVSFIPSAILRKRIQRASVYLARDVD